MTDFDFLVFIGRFEPFHIGHQAVARIALERARHVVVLVGSAETARTTKNPWTYEERVVMIREALADAEDRLTILPLRDHLYNEALWIAEVQRLVARAIGGDGRAHEREGDGAKRVGLIGQNKDESSYYLREFPQWPVVDVRHTASLSATDIRRFLFSREKGALLNVRANVPEPVYEMLASWVRSSTAYPQLLAEQEFLDAYRASWKAAPYPPTFVTADAVVTHSGHVLLIRRRAEPGKGLWAIPGGFLEPHEHLLDAAIRELREETTLDIAPDAIRASLKQSRVFDRPERSLRGRTITHAFHFDFPRGELPVVDGGDDAELARWLPIADVLAMSSQLFEDHFHILEYFLNRG